MAASPGSACRSYFHDVFFECIAVYGPCLETISVGIDGVKRIVQDLGYACRVIDAHAADGQNPQIGVELFAFFEYDAAFGSEQVIDFLDKIGIEMQEGIIENLVELCALLLDETARFSHAVEFVSFPGRNLALGDMTEIVELVHIDRTQLQKLIDVDVFAEVGIVQAFTQAVEIDHLAVEEHECGGENDEQNHHDAYNHIDYISPAVYLVVVGLSDDRQRTR